METEKIVIDEVKDPIASFLKKWGDKIITWLLAFAVIFLFVKFYFDAKKTNLRQAADNLSSLQEVAKELETTPNKDRENTLNDNIKTLKESVPPYNKIAQAYSAKVLAQSKDTAKKVNFITNWKQESSTVFDELALFTVARSLIDEKSEIALKSLEDLVKSGQYYNYPALSVLLKIDNQKYQGLKKEFISKHPEQSDLLK